MCLICFDTIQWRRKKWIEKHDSSHTTVHIKPTLAHKHHHLPSTTTRNWRHTAHIIIIDGNNKRGGTRKMADIAISGVNRLLVYTFACTYICTQTIYLDDVQKCWGLLNEFHLRVFSLLSELVVLIQINC